MFVHFTAEKVIIWERTANLRMFAELPQMPPRLQQAWRDLNSNDYEWRDVPLVVEQLHPPHGAA